MGSPEREPYRPPIAMLVNGIPVFCDPWFSEQAESLLITDRHPYPYIWCNPMPAQYILCHQHHVTQLRFDLWIDGLERELGMARIRPRRKHV